MSNKTFFPRVRKPGRGSIGRLLSDPFKGISDTSGSSGIPARLWRTMLFDLGIDGKKYGRLMRAFLMDPRNGIPNNRREHTNNAGNYGKDFARDTMTWKTLMRGLRFLQFEGGEIIIRGRHRDGTITEHRTSFDLGGYEELEEIEKLEVPKETETISLVGKLPAGVASHHTTVVDKGELDEPKAVDNELADNETHSK